MRWTRPCASSESNDAFNDSLLVDISGAVAPTHELLTKHSGFKAWRHMLAFTREFEEPTLAQRASLHL